MISREFYETIVSAKVSSFGDFFLERNLKYLKSIRYMKKDQDALIASLQSDNFRKFSKKFSQRMDGLIQKTEQAMKRKREIRNHQVIQRNEERQRERKNLRRFVGNVDRKIKTMSPNANLLKRIGLNSLGALSSPTNK